MHKGWRKAAHVRCIHTEGSVDTCQEGIGRGKGKGGELEGQGVVRQSTQARWVAMNRMPQYRRAKHERKEARAGMTRRSLRMRSSAATTQSSEEHRCLLTLHLVSLPQPSKWHPATSTTTRDVPRAGHPVYSSPPVQFVI